MVWVTGLLTTLLVLAADFAAPKPVEQAGLHVLLGIACILLAPAFAILQSFVTTRRWAGVEIQEHRADFLHRSLLGSNIIIWMFGCVGLLAVARWPQLIRHNWHLGSVPLVDELALALPMIGSVLLSWLVIYDAEKALRVFRHDAAMQRVELACQRLRTFTGLVLVPIALLFLGRDLMALTYPDGIPPVAAGIASAGFLVLLLSFYPVLLSLTWRTRHLEDRTLAQKLQAAAAEAGLPNERIRVWDTESTVTNAVVAGVIPGLRRIFLSDQLLKRFEPEEVVAIYRHELGHLVHRHLPMRVALMLVPLIALMILAVLTSPAEPQTYNARAIQTSIWLLGGLAFLGYISHVVTRFVRKSEIQADLFAICRRNGRVCLRRADAYSQALLKMAAQSPELYERSTAAHPSIKLRMEVIRQVIRQPEKIRQFDQKFWQDQQIAALCLTLLVISAAILGKMM